jgi:hypothetical protein
MTTQLQSGHLRLFRSPLWYSDAKAMPGPTPSPMLAIFLIYFCKYKPYAIQEPGGCWNPFDTGLPCPFKSREAVGIPWIRTVTSQVDRLLKTQNYSSLPLINACTHCQRRPTSCSRPRSPFPVDECERQIQLRVTGKEREAALLYPSNEEMILLDDDSAPIWSLASFPQPIVVVWRKGAPKIVEQPAPILPAAQFILNSVVKPLHHIQ